MAIRFQHQHSPHDSTAPQNWNRWRRLQNSPSVDSPYFSFFLWNIVSQTNDNTHTEQNMMSMYIFPTLTTDRLTIRTLNTDFQEEIVRLLGSIYRHRRHQRWLLLVYSSGNNTYHFGRFGFPLLSCRITKTFSGGNIFGVATGWFFSVCSTWTTICSTWNIVSFGSVQT